MAEARQPRKLFKYYLEQQATIDEKRPLFFRRNLRWRVNSVEYATPFSKKGLLRGYIKYGALAYMSYYYTRYRLFAPSHDHHGHDSHGHAAHGHDAHGHGAHVNDSHAKGHDAHGDKGHGKSHH